MFSGEKRLNTLFTTRILKSASDLYITQEPYCAWRPFCDCHWVLEISSLFVAHWTQWSGNQSTRFQFRPCTFCTEHGCAWWLNFYSLPQKYKEKKVKDISLSKWLPNVFYFYGSSFKSKPPQFTVLWIPFQLIGMLWNNWHSYLGRIYIWKTKIK